MKTAYIFRMRAVVKSRNLLSRVAQLWQHVLPLPYREGISCNIDLLQHYLEKESWFHLRGKSLCIFKILHKYTVFATLPKNSTG